MRCSCQLCGTYMIQSDGSELGCVCPDCLHRCKACLGTDTVISRDDLLRVKHFVDSNPDSETSFSPSDSETN